MNENRIYVDLTDKAAAALREVQHDTNAIDGDVVGVAIELYAASRRASRAGMRFVYADPLGGPELSVGSPG